MLTRLILLSLAVSLTQPLAMADPPADPLAEARFASRMKVETDLDFTDVPLADALAKVLEGSKIPAIIVLPDKDDEELRVTLCVKQLAVNMALRLMLAFQSVKGQLVSGLYVVGPKAFKPSEMLASPEFAASLSKQLMAAMELDLETRRQLLLSTRALASAKGGDQLKKRLGDAWAMVDLLSRPALRSVVRLPSDPARVARAKTLVAQLGARKFKQRESAHEALKALGHDAHAALRVAATSSAPEIKRRATHLLARLATMRVLAETIVRVESTGPLVIKHLRGPALPQGASLHTVDSAGQTGAIKLTKGRRLVVVEGTFVKGRLLRIEVDRQLSEPPATREQLITRGERALQDLEPLLGAIRSRESDLEEIRLEERPKGAQLERLAAAQARIKRLKMEYDHASQGIEVLLAGRLRDPGNRQLHEHVTTLESQLKALLADARARFGLTAEPAGLSVWKITKVAPGGPADKAGVRAGDLLTRVGEWPVGADEHGFLAGLLRPVSGRPLPLTFTKDGEARRVQLTPR